MTEEQEHTELTQADTLNRLTYLVQLHKDRANDESIPSHRRGDPLKITVFTSGALACVELSMTKAKELIKKTWSEMSREAERYVEDPDFTSATPSMKLHLTEYGRLWMSAFVDRTAGPELQAKWDAIDVTRREQFPE